MADRRKLAQGLMMMTPAMREDLAGREQDIQRGKTVELLRRAGKEMYENPIVNTAIGLTPGAGDLQSGYEAYNSAREGNYGESALNALGVLPFIPSMGFLGKTVWHGSPHGFERFDMSKIGTGEGAQAYGHGLYLAEARPTAEGYRQSLSGGASKAVNASYTQDPELWVAGQMHSGIPNQDIAEGLKALGYEGDTNKLLEQGANRLNNELNAGYLYKVDLPDEQIAKMLDWDKPLSEQPEIMQALRNSEAFGPQSPSWAGAPEGLWEKNIGARTGSDFYLKNKWADDQAKGSAMLYEAGIPGIQYLDQASRGAGEGTRNYVVFSDEIPQILERNGTPLGNAVREYRGSHTAPGPEFGAQLHDLTGGGQMYPDDIYSANAVRYYGTGDTALDKESFAIAQRMRNKPDEMVDIYRAVPNEGDITAINAGDWVTINPNYAKQHGESNLPEGYKILSQKVPAKSVWTNADSIHEYGYWPE